MFSANCSVCRGPITWQEIRSGIAVEIRPGEVACTKCLSGDVISSPEKIEDGFISLGSHGPVGSIISE